jgi:hypothetical protein
MTRGVRLWLALAVAALVNGVLVWHFHDRYWYPTDDGFYAHLAERLLSGEVLNRDIQDIHPGYIHFLHAAAFRLFGVDLVSLRYPLIAATLVQGALVFALLQSRGLITATLGSIAITSIGVIQFFDPTPNWYCLMLSVAMIGWMTWRPMSDRYRLPGAGVLLGLVTLFRQLTGVWVAMGLLVVVLLERSEQTGARGGIVARSVVAIMMAGLLGYLIVSPETEPGGVVLIALWPVAILGWLFLNVRVSDRTAAVAFGTLLAGAIAAVLPLLLYHLAHGSTVTWLSDTVVAGFRETQMPFFGHGWYGLLPIAGSYQMLTSFHPALIVNGWYWTMLPLASLTTGLAVVNRLHRLQNTRGLILPIFASFHALVSIYFEGPLYLYYGAGLSLAAVLWLAADGERRWRVLSQLCVAAAIVVAVVFHAGQPRSRTPMQILEGDRASTVSTNRGLRRASLRLDPSDRVSYERIISRIERSTGPDDTIVALPNDAELYFLAKRRNPFRFYNAALGVLTPPDLDGVIAEFERHPPRLVAFRPDDKYNTQASSTIMDFVRAHYERIDTIDGLDLYVTAMPPTAGGY